MQQDRRGCVSSSAKHSTQTRSPTFINLKDRKITLSYATQLHCLDTLGVEKLYDFTLEKAIVQIEEEKQKANLPKVHSSHNTSRIFSPLKDRLKQKAMGHFNEADNVVKTMANKLKPKHSASSDKINNGAEAASASFINVKLKPLDVRKSTEEGRVAVTRKESLEETAGAYYRKSNSVLSNSYTQGAYTSDQGHSNSDEPSLSDMMRKYVNVLSSFVSCTGKL